MCPAPSKPSSSCWQRCVAAAAAAAAEAIPPQTHSQHCTRLHTSPPRNLLALLQARGLGVSELQCQAWGGSADALEASALALLELDPDFLTVSPRQHLHSDADPVCSRVSVRNTLPVTEREHKHFPDSSGLFVCQGVERQGRRVWFSVLLKRCMCSPSTCCCCRRSSCPAQLQA